MPAASGDLPDFHIPHAEKIDWMIETHGYAVETVSPQPDAEPPVGGCTYTIGFPEAFGFAEVVVFGLAPAAANGILGLVADLLRGGTEIPAGVALTGLFDGEQRALFLPVDTTVHGAWFATAASWRRCPASELEVVQLLWPDRRGFLPVEAGYDHRLQHAQPVLGHFDS